MSEGFQWIWHWSYYPKKRIGVICFSYFVSNIREYILYLPISYYRWVQWGLLWIGSATKLLISSTVGDCRGAGYEKIGMLETFDFRGEMGKFMDMLFDIMGNSYTLSTAYFFNTAYCIFHSLLPTVFSNEKTLRFRVALFSMCNISHKSDHVP